MGRDSSLWWFDIAKCRGRGHVFISPGPNTPMCKRICESCDAMDVCLWYAVSREQAKDDGKPLRFGIFGGFSAHERDEFVTRYNITRETAYAEYVRARDELERRLADGST